MAHRGHGYSKIAGLRQAWNRAGRVTMMASFPGDLEAGIQSLLDHVSRRSIFLRARAMSEAYRLGQDSTRAIGDIFDVAAYLTTRMPATFAAIAAVLREVARLRPDFTPRRMLDLCAGPGTASWAAAAEWPELATITMLDAHAGLLDVAKSLAAASDRPALREVNFVCSDALATTLPEADLIIMAYALVELPERAMATLAHKLWEAADMVVLVEPGTPQGFHRIRLCRDAFLGLGAAMVAPCPHAMPCPIREPDWCHFSQRLTRSRDHRLIKGASAPFEDERYAFVAVGRTPSALPVARILGPVKRSKAEAVLRLCKDGSIVETKIRKGDPRFTRTKKSDWGGAWPDTDF